MWPAKHARCLRVWAPSSLFPLVRFAATVTPMQRLNKQDRMRLMRFVCSFAWADFEIQKEERAFIGKLVRQLELDDDEKREVEGLLQRPPRPEDVDPARIPKRHREIFLDVARATIAADGMVAPEEVENLELLEALLK